MLNKKKWLKYRFPILLMVLAIVMLGALDFTIPKYPSINSFKKLLSKEFELRQSLFFKKHKTNPHDFLDLFNEEMNHTYSQDFYSKPYNITEEYFSINILPFNRQILILNSKQKNYYCVYHMFSDASSEENIVGDCYQR